MNAKLQKLIEEKEKEKAERQKRVDELRRREAEQNTKK